MQSLESDTRQAAWSTDNGMVVGSALHIAELIGLLVIYNLENTDDLRFESVGWFLRHRLARMRLR